MINAAMRLRIARLAKTHLPPAMRTHVPRYMNLALTVTRHNHIVLAPVANNEIPRLRYIRLMTQQQPRLRENPDRKSVVSGTNVYVRVEIGGRRILKKKKK